MDKIKMGHPLLTIIKIIAALFFLCFAIFAANTVNGRVTDSVADSRWGTSSGESLVFHTSYGTWKKSGVATDFIYEESRGYVKCTLVTGPDDLLEMNHISGERLFCVTRNVVFYEIKASN